ncbi:MAG TPA: tyrosinase family protein [Vicinamibacterales bacterium]|nr:tyrosinase family protein [Vicinamibacterales bacterium]
MATKHRRNVWELGNDWADDILWYARGVKAMKAHPLKQRTSWRFYAAMHGFFDQLWELYGYFSASDTRPPNADIARFWDQCQHGSWYFLPWHRGYLLAFEASVRAEVVALNGPPEWALPYWNYFKPNQAALPPAFASPDWPDGTGDNPLFVPQRYGPDNDGTVVIPVDQISLRALSEPDFAGVSSGGSPGFGGVDTGFEHGGRVHGRVESQPHDWVHVLIGGSDPTDSRLPGLMSDPDTAALDPIFWLHHANIDRLWEVWRQHPPTHVDPTQAKWTKGPGASGGRVFSMPMPDGTRWDYTPADVAKLATLGYDYDDLAAPVAPNQLTERLTRLAPDRVAAIAAGVQPMASGKNVELVGANQQAVRIVGSEARTAVPLDKEVRSKVAASLTAAPDTADPDRVFLNLENVRGLADATAFQVYVGVRNAGAGGPRELLAGSVALFGVRKATSPDGPQAGEGLTYVLEITDLVDDLHLQDGFDADALDVRIVPIRPVPEEAEISIGRISVFRQGQ